MLLDDLQKNLETCQEELDEARRRRYAAEAAYYEALLERALARALPGVFEHLRTALILLGGHYYVRYGTLTENGIEGMTAEEELNVMHSNENKIHCFNQEDPSCWARDTDKAAIIAALRLAIDKRLAIHENAGETVASLLAEWA